MSIRILDVDHWLKSPARYEKKHRGIPGPSLPGYHFEDSFTDKQSAIIHARTLSSHGKDVVISRSAGARLGGGRDAYYKEETWAVFSKII